MTCPNCGSLAPEGARFCPSCGGTLEAPTDERRVVTVLFGDVVGFTAMAEARDPENVKNAIDRCFERLVGDITAFGGRVDKIVGDAIVALFGVPVSHEDDPERAVRAALRMQATLAEYTAETEVPLRMRIGINTGEVLVGALRAGGDVTAMGDVVNIANRLQTAARPGQVFVGPDTYSGTRDVIRYRSLGAVATRGRDEPVEAWEAEEPVGPPGFRPRRAPTPLIGRKAEIGMLWHALGTSVEHRRPHLILLVGEAGVGKTRLVEEVAEVARQQHDAIVLEGRCLPYGEANVWWPVAEIVRAACEISATDPADVAVEKCRSAVTRLVGVGEDGDTDRVVGGLLYLTGHEGALSDLEPSRARDEAFRALITCLGAMASERPVVIVISELHWAADIALELVDKLFERLRNLPVVFIGTARPELEDRWGPKPGRHNQIVMNLDPLDAMSADRLISHLSGRDLPPELRTLLVERSGGNPLFLEELVGLLGDSGVLDGDVPVELPATLRGLVAARVDALGREERSVLEDAAVAGRSGPVDAVAALAEARGARDPVGRLDTLAMRELLNVSAGEYSFKSDLVRDVAYETLTKAERARRHASLAQWLEDRASRMGREDEDLERIAHHYGISAELVADLGTVDGVPTDVHNRALSWLARAGARAEHRDTAAISVHLFEQALRLAGPEPSEQRRALLLGRAKARASLREITGATEDVRSVLDEIIASGDHRLHADALSVLGDVQTKAGDYAEGVKTLEEAASQARSMGDRRAEAEALRLYGMAHLFRGDLEQADEAYLHALRLFVELEDRRGEAWCLQNLAWSSFYRGDHEVAEERLHRSAQVFGEIGDTTGLGWVMGLLGYVAYFKGDLAVAEAIAEKSHETTKETGDRWARGMMLTLLANVRLWRGRTRDSVECAREAVALFEEIEDRFGICQSGIALSVGLVLSGHVDEGLEMARHVTEVGSDLDDAQRFFGRANLANILSLAGDAQGALAQPEPEHRAGEPDASAAGEHDIGEAQMRALAAFVLVQAGRPEEAKETLAGSLGVADRLSDGARARVLGVGALTCAAAGALDEAFLCRDRIRSVEGGTYLDRFLAHLGAALASARQGRTSDADAAFAEAWEILEATQDVLHRAVLRLAQAQAGTLEEDPNAQVALANARDELISLGMRGNGWETAIRLAATGGASALTG